MQRFLCIFQPACLRSEAANDAAHRAKERFWEAAGARERLRGAPDRQAPHVEDFRISGGGAALNIADRFA